MSTNIHEYKTRLSWTGNTGSGTIDYNRYSRNFQWHSKDKPMIEGSSDPAFKGDPYRHNPEELLVASLSSCHMLWFLHLCADHGIVILAYEDHAEGTMEEEKQVLSKEGQRQIQGGHFSKVTLYPIATVARKEDIAKASELHQVAHKRCFIANSVNFPVQVQATFR